MNHTSIPEEELEFFKKISDVKVVFDVGARADCDYVELKPDIELHSFEPNPEFFVQLKEKVGNRSNVHLNNYGLGDVPGVAHYSDSRQGFVGGEEGSIQDGRLLPIHTLDWYMKEQGIEQIDFLKIDTEGYDFRVLLGGLNTIRKCRYIQYEHWNDKRRFHYLLGQDFSMEYIGGRNVFCTRLW